MELISKDIPSELKEIYTEGLMSNFGPIVPPEIPMNLYAPRNIAYSPVHNRFVVAVIRNDSLYQNQAMPDNAFDDSQYPLHPTFYTCDGPDFTKWKPSFLPKFALKNGSKIPISNFIINRCLISHVIWSAEQGKFLAIAKLYDRVGGSTGSSPNIVLTIYRDTGIHLLESSDGINWSIRGYLSGNIRGFSGLSFIAGDIHNYNSISANTTTSVVIGFNSIFNYKHHWVYNASQVDRGPSFHQTDTAPSMCSLWVPTWSLFIGANTSTSYSSTDGVTWTARTAMNNRSIMAWSPVLNMAIACEQTSGTNRYHTTINGTAWTARTGLDSFHIPRMIKWSEYHNAFIAICQNNSSTAVQVVTSTDGLAWTQVRMFNKTTNFIMNDFDVSTNGTLIMINRASTSDTVFGDRLYYVSPGFASSSPTSLSISEDRYFSSVTYDTNKKAFYAINRYTSPHKSNLYKFTNPNDITKLHTVSNVLYHKIEYIPELRKSIVFGYGVGYVSSNDTIIPANIGITPSLDCMMAVAWDSRRKRLLGIVTKKAQVPPGDPETHTALFVTYDGVNWEELEPTIFYRENRPWSESPMYSLFPAGLGTLCSETSDSTASVLKNPVITLVYSEEMDCFITSMIASIDPLIVKYQTFAVRILEGGSTIQIMDNTPITPDYITWSPSNKVFLGTRNSWNDTFVTTYPALKFENSVTEDQNPYNPFCYSKDGINWELIDFSTAYEQFTYNIPYIIKWIKELGVFIALQANKGTTPSSNIIRYGFISSNGFDWKEFIINVNESWSPLNASDTRVEITDFVWSQEREMLVAVSRSPTNSVLYAKAPRLIVSEDAPKSLEGFGPGDIWIQTTSDKPFYAP